MLLRRVAGKRPVFTFSGEHAMRVIRLVLFVAVFLQASGAATQAAGRDLSYQAWLGAMTESTVDHVLFRPGGVTFFRSGLVGLALHRRFGPELETPFGRINFEAEAHIVRHFGRQQHWEFNLPIGFRFTANRPVLGLIDSAAFGIGPSHATRPPPVEERRNPSGARTRVYFHIEVARTVGSDPMTQLFLRVHHRSGAWGVVAPAGTSNAVAAGIRRQY